MFFVFKKTHCYCNQRTIFFFSLILDKIFNDVSKDDEGLECVESEVGVIADNDETGCSSKTETDLELNNNTTVPAEQQKDKYG